MSSEQRIPGKIIQWFRRLRWIDWIYLLVIASFGVFVLQAALMRPVNRFHNWTLREEFESQRALWEDNDITHYRMTFSYLNPYMIVCPGASIEVIGNGITEVKSTTGYHTHAELQENCAHHYKWFTIDSIFEQIERYLYGNSMSVGSAQVEYDEQYGYPKRFYITNSGIGDLENITIIDFEVLND